MGPTSYTGGAPISTPSGPAAIRVAALLVTALLVALVLALGDEASPPAAAGPEPTATAPDISVVGGRLVDERGRALRLRGVNRAGLEWRCGSGEGTHEGPLDAAALDALVAWGGNAVRLPLNAHCWLGPERVPGLSPADSGPAYRRMVVDLARRLAARGQHVIIDLHWSAPAGRPAGQHPMPDADHAPFFWRSAGRALRDVPGVLFELYNEPHGVDWGCWRSGCDVDGWRAAGMQELIDAIRASGARQPIIATGLRWGNDLSGWREAGLRDPAGRLIAGFHAYSFNDCAEPACWEREVAPVADGTPVVITEFGDDVCRPRYARSLMDWADRKGISYIGWAWYPGDCAAFPALISDWSGTPTPYGRALRERLARG